MTSSSPSGRDREAKTGAVAPLSPKVRLPSRESSACTRPSAGRWERRQVGRQYSHELAGSAHMWAAGQLGLA